MLIKNILRLAGVFMVALLGGFIVFMLRRERRAALRAGGRA